MIERIVFSCPCLRLLIASRLMWGALLVMPALVPGSDLRAEEDDSKIQSTKVDTSRWLCSLCIYPIGWFGSADFGPGYISDSC